MPEHNDEQEKGQTPVEKTQIPEPKVTFTPQALDQLRLIVENDFTLGGKYFRLLISGKGCDGFTYSAGFTDLDTEDLLIPVANEEGELQQSYGEKLMVIMDPFTAFYLQECSVDYIQDFENDTEGFSVINHQQQKYAGKFWRRDQNKIPPTKKNEGDRA